MSQPLVSIVVIGRDEGERLGRCFASIHAASQHAASQHAAGWPRANLELIYVDSASCDGSPQLARSFGAATIVLHPERPTAALARNAGWRRARGEFILFLDGDTILHPAFIHRALPHFAPSQVAAVWGHRRELHPAASVFNRVLDLDWIYPPGLSDFCGGDALMRRAALEQAGGFDDSLIAGEEPELCARLRARSWRIVHIDEPMTSHDLAMHSLVQYWRRATRAGYAYAEISERLRGMPAPLWEETARRNRLRLAQGVVVLLSASAGCLFTRGVWPGLAAALGVLLVVARTAWRNRWKGGGALTLLLYGIHSHVQQIPIFFGQLKYRRDKRRSRPRGLIEYKARP